MAHQEAGPLFIEQAIKEGLSQGKTPYAIGKELAAWVEKRFEMSIPVNTLMRRAERTRENFTTNVVNPATPQILWKTRINNHFREIVCQRGLLSRKPGADHFPAQAHNPTLFTPIFSPWVGNKVENQKEKD